MLGQWRLAWQLARRFRRGRERSRFLSFISASSTSGIALGCLVFITGLSVMNGFAEVLQERFLKLVPHIEFSAVEGRLHYPETIFALAADHPGVTAAWPLIHTQALVQQGREFIGVKVTGVDATGEHAIKDYLRDQQWSALATPNTVILGSGLAQQLGVARGDSIRFVVAAERGFQAPKRIALTVIDTFEFGGQFDHQLAYVNLATARSFVGLESCFSTVALAVDDLFSAERIANEIGYQLRDYVYLEHWMRSQGHLYRDIQMVRMVMYLVLVLVLAVASFNIVSTLVMTVQEKQRHIGILRTMGLRTGSLMQVFILQGLQNGIFGVTFGVVGGVLLSLNLPALVSLLERLSGDSLLASDVYFVNQIPVLLEPKDVLMVAAVGLVMSLFATLYPAWQAAKLDVVQAINA